MNVSAENKAIAKHVLKAFGRRHGLEELFEKHEIDIFDISGLSRSAALFVHEEGRSRQVGGLNAKCNDAFVCHLPRHADLRAIEICSSLRAPEEPATSPEA